MRVGRFVSAVALGLVLVRADGREYEGRHLFGMPATIQKFEGCSVGAFPPDPKDQVPTHVINLDLPPRQRWTELMLEKKKETYQLLQNMKNLTAELFHGKLFKLIDTYFPRLAETLPYPFYDEMVGISEATGIPIGEITLYNIFYEIFTVCTSIVAQSKDGRIYHGRNLDFGLFLGWDKKNHSWLTTEYLKPLVVQLDFQKGGKTLFKSVQFVGYTGVITGLKPGQFSVTVDERFGVVGGFVGILEWIFGYRDQQWMGFLVRQALENATSYREAQKMLAKANLLAPVYFIMSGPESGEGTVITRGRFDFDILTLGQMSVGQKSNWYLVETNYDHWKVPPFFDDRRTPAMTCMEKIGAGNISKAAMYNVLSTKPVLNKLTTYTVLMEVRSGAMESWVRYCADPCWPW